MNMVLNVRKILTIYERGEHQRKVINFFLNFINSYIYLNSFFHTCAVGKIKKSVRYICKFVKSEFVITMICTDLL